MLRHKEFFNSIAGKWDEICRNDGDKLNSIIKMARICHGDKVLDVGTGTGIMLPYIYNAAKAEGKIVAVDIAENMLNIAMQKNPMENIDFVLGDICEVELPREYFDVALCYSVFPHFRDQEGTLRHLADLLKSKGRVIIAHSQSREAINSLHSRSDDAVSQDELPDTATIEKYMLKAGIAPRLTVDNEEMFVVIGEKGA